MISASTPARSVQATNSASQPSSNLVPSAALGSRTCAIESTGCSVRSEAGAWRVTGSASCHSGTVPAVAAHARTTKPSTAAAAIHHRRFTLGTLLVAAGTVRLA